MATAPRSTACRWTSPTGTRPGSCSAGPRRSARATRSPRRSGRRSRRTTRRATSSPTTSCTPGTSTPASHGSRAGARTATTRRCSSTPSARGTSARRRTPRSPTCSSPATTCRPTSTSPRWRAATSRAGRRWPRCCTQPGRRPSRRGCTSSTRRPSSRRSRRSTPSATATASPTHSTWDEDPGSSVTDARPARSRGPQHPRGHFDAIVVGARCAGSAAAIGLARAGRRVVALDRVRFPADTISTHLLWPGGVAEVKTLGALERVQALGAPELPIGLAGAAGMTLRGDFTPIDDIAYALCVRRPGFDAALVERAREAGAEVREGIRVTELVREGGRVCGVRCGDDELRAPLVIGADGRRSTVARLAGAEQPYRWARSGRDCFYAYWRDARPEWRSTAAQWREGPDLGTAFPCDGGLVLVLVQPPADRAGEYRCIVDAIPELARRLEGCEQVTKVRAATGIASYFRRSAGRGWALAGD